MVFSGIPFLYYFLPAVLILYYLVPARGKNPVLLAASLFFYGYGEPRFLLLMLMAILQGYGFALLTERQRDRRRRRIPAVLSAVLSMGILFWFKYAEFFADSFRAASGLPLPVLRIALPVGVSFYTFQILSYTADVYRGTCPAEKNLLDFACYVSMFPQLIAGPIVRYTDLAREMKGRSLQAEKIYEGLRRFLAGLGKKVLLANQLYSLCELFRQSEEKSLLFYWIYAVAFSLYVYYDFSGYSDMAIGLGKMLGFTFPENFRYPFLSRSASEFWRRWHMTLGGWFRDYVYIPLGGSRRGTLRWLRNLLIVWLLTGLWHGAAWNFLLWGLFFAVLLAGEGLWYGKYLRRIPLWGAWIYPFFFITFSFVIFNGSSAAEALRDLCCLLGGGGLPITTAETVYYLRSFGILLLLGVLGSTPLAKNLYDKLRSGKKTGRILAALEPLLLAGLLLVCTAYLVDGSFNPFLYFRF